ncbi:hypothetical protein, partial [Thermococcus sp.]|uniref:hypothetical protein n=1 Tax=Thermococcus sp. TaxID=35749 RepID=UPI0025F5F680
IVVGVFGLIGTFHTILFYGNGNQPVGGSHYHREVRLSTQFCSTETLLELPQFSRTRNVRTPI